MKTAKYIEAKILKLIPSAVHRGVVFDQDVLVETTGGKKIVLFDYTKLGGLCTKKMVGKIKKIKVGILTSAWPEEKPQKISFSREEIISKDKGYEIYGKITAVEKNNYVLQTSVGAFHFSKNKFDFKIGDHVKLFSVRLDLLEIV